MDRGEREVIGEFCDEGREVCTSGVVGGEGGAFLRTERTVTRQLSSEKYPLKMAKLYQ